MGTLFFLSLFKLIKQSKSITTEHAKNTERTGDPAPLKSEQG
jgi:hypothetical protein